MQYTIRNITNYLDSQLRTYAQTKGISLNQAVIKVLHKGLGIADEPQYFSDLDSLIGTWIEDQGFDHAIRDQNSIYEEL